MSTHQLVIADATLRGLSEHGQIGIDVVYDAVTTTAATVLGVDGHRPEVGGNADLVVHEEATLRSVLAHHEAPAYVVASGQVAATSTSSAALRLPGSEPDVRV
jgi:cytosine deaminase